MNLVLFAILFAGVLQGGILSALLVRKQNNRLSSRILATLVLVLVIHLSLVAIDIRDLFLLFPHLSRLSWLIPLLYGPLILLLTQSIVSRGFRMQAAHLLYFIPFIIYLVILFPYYLKGAEEKLAYLSDEQLVKEADFGIYNYITNYIHIAFASISLFTFYQHKKTLPDYFSDPGRARFGWLEAFLWGIWLIMVYSWFCFISRRYDWPFLSSLYPNNFLLAVLLIYWISYKLLLNPYPWDQPLQVPAAVSPPPVGGNAANIETNTVKYQKTAISSRDMQEIKEKLIQVMRDKKPYLDPALTIDDLADLLQVKRHHLSQVINQEFSMNFFEFINTYRVSEFKEQATNTANEHLSIMGLAFDCGFNSKATFNQVFKKQEGLTPSAFLKQQRG